MHVIPYIFSSVIESVINRFAVGRLGRMRGLPVEESLRWTGLMILLLPMLSACGEVQFPMGPAPTGRPLITIIEPPIGATRVAAFGQPATTKVRTSQPYKTIQGYVQSPDGRQIGHGSLPPAAPEMYYWAEFGVAFVATISGIYQHEYLAANEYGIDFAQGLFTIYVNHTLAANAQKSFFRTCPESCDDNTSPPPRTPSVQYVEALLTPYPYFVQSFAATADERDLRGIANQASLAFLDYVAEQYGPDIEGWLVENGFLKTASNASIDFEERVDLYVDMVHQSTDSHVLPSTSMFGLESRQEIVTFLYRLKDIYKRKTYESGKTTEPGLVSEEEPAPSLSFDAYPNPAKDRVSFSVSDVEDIAGRLAVYDVLGRVVRSWTIPPDRKRVFFDWDMTAESGLEVPAGRYFVVGHLGRRFVSQALTIVR